ncbi:MAG: alpha/beta hydrolase [Okeania sp. SIO2H7]|nr:alpha/beta hydrolase [Okeania sp. SIO2H7]
MNSSNNRDFYSWKGYRCAYEYYPSLQENDVDLPLLLLHPIGVGLSNNFWHRFCSEWRSRNFSNSIYNPDLLGCGDSDMPRVAYYPEDWAGQLQFFLENVVKKPVIAIAQGATLPVLLSLIKIQQKPNFLKGLIYAGPPSWEVITTPRSERSQKITWNLLSSPLGNAFYRYARRRQFLTSFSIKQLFGDAKDVDDEWLDTLEKGAVNLQSRHAVFSFLAGFWRQNYQEAIASIQQPTLVVFGEGASSISRTKNNETSQERLDAYLKTLPRGEGSIIPGRNVLPYESPAKFVDVVGNFYQKLVNC